MAAQKLSHKFWPLFLSTILLLAIVYCCWLLWQAHSRQINAASAQSAIIAELTHKRDELTRLLAMSPCDAKASATPGLLEKPAAVTPTTPTVISNSGHDLIENACVFIVSTDGKTKMSTGSGFFVAPGYVLTNRHVVQGGTGNVLITNKKLGHPARAAVVAQSQGKNTDYALLKVDTPETNLIAPLSLTTSVKKTDKVGAWGFPDLVGKNDPGYAGLLHGDLASAPELSYTEGVVSAILERTPPVIVHTAPISPGNSGGPLVNQNGEVVGINTMITLDESSYRQASLALATADLIRFLAANGINL